MDAGPQPDRDQSERSVVGLALVLAAAMSAQAPATQSATELLIRVRPPAGETQPVRLENAQLLLAWWGYSEEVPLAHRYEAGELLVTVPLGRDVWSSHGQAPDFAYVYLEFDGFVPVRSEQFYWLGGSAPTGSRGSWETVTAVQFRFRAGPVVRIRQGEKREVRLQARRAIPKQVRFLDDLDRPVSDITVDGGAFWSRNNHCGHPGGLKPLFEDRRPDASGVLPVPDGDVEYGFWMKGATHISVVGAESYEPYFFNTYIDTPEEVIRIKRHRREPLSLRVSIGGAPAAGVIVGATGVAGCMNTTFEIGRTDARGVLRVRDFYPEEYEGVCIGGEDGRVVWAVARPARGEIRVDLPAGTKVGEVTYCGDR